jgi:hypothetical protein
MSARREPELNAKLRRGLIGLESLGQCSLKAAEGRQT